jgi:hypothetical protein
VEANNPCKSASNAPVVLKAWASCSAINFLNSAAFSLASECKFSCLSCSSQQKKNKNYMTGNFNATMQNNFFLFSHNQVITM